MTHFQKNMSVLKELFELLLQRITQYGVCVLRINLDFLEPVEEREPSGITTIIITVDLLKLKEKK